MNLNPVIIIPTYWCSRRTYGSADRNAVYDRMTPIDKQGNLARCLESLRKVQGLGRIIVLAAAESGVENQASEKVRAILAKFSDLNVAMVTAPELRHVHRQMEQVGMGALKPCVSLNGYGAIHNLGILAASIFGHDTIVFLEDDVIVDRPDFLERAIYGLGAKTPTGGVVTVKTGYYLDEEGSRLAKPEKRWYRKPWCSAAQFNAYIEPALNGPRLSVANTATSSCMVLHADAFGSVSFDPWVTRGEDLDYVINCRMYNRDVWLDNKLSVQRMPEEKRNDAANFEQDMIRWFYEGRKIEYTKAQIDLMQIMPGSMEPFPGKWLERGVKSKARNTCLLSVIGDKEHGAFFKLLKGGIKDAAAYAQDNCSRYFEFQRQWPALVRALWSCTPLATQLSGARIMQSSTPSFTGRFAAVRVEDIPQG